MLSIEPHLLKLPVLAQRATHDESSSLCRTVKSGWVPRTTVRFDDLLGGLRT